MHSRELVYKTLDFNSHQRVPRDLWVLPWARENYPQELQKIQARFPSDFVSAPARYATPVLTTGDPYLIGTFTDDWGCTFVNIQNGYIGEVRSPLVDIWEKWETVQPPLNALSLDKTAVNAFSKKSERFVFGGCCPRPFERMQFLRGSQNLYIDLADPPGEFFELLDVVHQFYIKELELWAETDVDGLNFMDDWGSQYSLLINPQQWRKIFKPLYKDYIDIAHQAGKRIFMHSDGYIFDIYQDLIELGLDAINSQLFIMDIEEIGRQFGGQITFWGEIDRQHLLPHGTTTQITGAVQRVKEALYRNGGVIAQCEFGPGAKPENVAMVYQAWDDVS
jgi:uroporphyrinogen decarboxylase